MSGTEIKTMAPLDKEIKGKYGYSVGFTYVLDGETYRVENDAIYSDNGRDAKDKAKAKTMQLAKEHLNKIEQETGKKVDTKTVKFLVEPIYDSTLPNGGKIKHWYWR
jgi:hypothetical protein